MYIAAISGASGAILGIRLIEELLRAGEKVSAIVSDSAWKIIHYEILKDKEKTQTISEILKKRNFSCNNNNLKEFSNNNLFAPAASGTSGFKAVIVMPCSMKTLGAIASGYSDTLITRAADVALKENRKCILVPRETPLSLIHLENMVRAKQAGADILIPVPSFYTHPETLEEVVNYIVGKTLNLLGIKHDLFSPWGED